MARWYKRRTILAAAVFFLFVGSGIAVTLFVLRRPPRPIDRPDESDSLVESTPWPSPTPDRPELQETDWPGFRGPGGRATSLKATIPLEWADQRNLAWKTKLPGPGSSSPIVVGDRVFVTCYSGYGVDGGRSGKPEDLKRHLLCLNRADGSIVWKNTVDSAATEDTYRGYIAEHGYASSTPASDGEAVYAFFGKSGVWAYDLAGKRLWNTSVGTQSNHKGWGSGASLILHGDLVIVNASSESRSLRALDRKSGKEVWRADARSMELTFGTPSLVALPDGRTELALAIPGELWGFNLGTGKLNWYCAIRSTGNVSPSIVAGDGVVYATGGYDNRGTTAVRAGGSRDVSDSNTLWSVRETSYVPSPLLHEDRLHWVDEKGVAVCLNASTGKVLYRQALPIEDAGARPVYASLVLAGDRLIAVTRRHGTYVLAAGPEFTVLATNTLTDESDFNASPAVSGGDLLLRSNQALYCVRESKAQKK